MVSTRASGSRCTRRWVSSIGTGDPTESCRRSDLATLPALSVRRIRLDVDVRRLTCRQFAESCLHRQDCLCSTTPTTACSPAILVCAWRKSRASNPSGDCVEVARLVGGAIAVRNSRDPSGPALIHTRAEIAAFLQGAKDGEFDDLIA